MRHIFGSGLVLFFVTSLFAKDLTHRLGVGFKNNTSQNLPSLAAVYYPTTNMGFTTGLGVDTKKNESAFQANAGLRYLIYPEPNLNFYTAAQVAVLNYDTVTDGRQNAVDLAAVFGVEFFFTGLDNLAFTFEAGVALTSSSNSRLRTVGDDPVRAGLIFYF